MFKYVPGSIGFLLLTSIGSKAHAQVIENDINSGSQPNQEQTLGNGQNNAGAINQTSIYNVVNSATYKIQGLGGRQVVCPKASFILGGGYNVAGGFDFQNNSSYAVSASFIFPLGGKIGKTCKSMGNTIARKYQYDFELSTARSCATLTNTGISLNPRKFPAIFDVCNGMSLAKNDTSLFDQTVSPRMPTSPELKNLKSKRLKSNDFRTRKAYLAAKRRRRRDDY